MKPSRLLFFLLLLFLISNLGFATASARQDPEVQKKQEATKRAASDDEDSKAIPGLDDLPFWDRPIVSIEFRGNQAFSSEKLLDNFKYVKLGTRYNEKAKARLETELARLRVLLYVDNGYLRAQVKKPDLEDTPTGLKITIPIEEGVLYRAGEITIEDAKAFTTTEVLEILGLRKGDVIKGYSVVNKGIEQLKEAYGDKGYLEFNAEFLPEFLAPLPGANEAIADIRFVLEEGVVYRIGKISFVIVLFLR